MSKLVKRWTQEDGAGGVAIGYTYVGDSADLPIPVIYESWAGRGGSFDVPGDVVFINARGQRVRPRMDKARSARDVVKMLDAFFESGGDVKGSFNSVPAKSIVEASEAARELVMAAKELAADDFTRRLNDMMKSAERPMKALAEAQKDAVASLSRASIMGEDEDYQRMDAKLADAVSDLTDVMEEAERARRFVLQARAALSGR